MKRFLINASVIFIGALLFAASFPNPLFSYGLPLLAWVAYVPVFWVLRNIGPDPLLKKNLSIMDKTTVVSLVVSSLWGAFYGYTAYRLFVPWLGAFHPMADMLVSVLHLLYMAVLFPFLKLALILYPRKGYILQWLLWLSYEYLKTTGFLGFPYGITGYTQWQFPPLIGVASIFGVWGVSALVLFPSVYLGSAENRNFFRRERFAAAAWLGALGGTVVFGLIAAKGIDVASGDYGGGLAGTAKIALVQQNADPWKSDATGTMRILTTLKMLSVKALDESPGTELVVWPETAFTPRIFWHLNYRDDAESFIVVKELLDFLAVQKVPFLIGNDDARLEVTKSGHWDRVDYNAALLLEGGEIKETYRKNHLVPFGEYFPYEKTFPRMYKALVKADTHFWKPGMDKVVFNSGRLHFSAPICFEDCFGYISRDFTQNGAQFIVNLTNDAWAGSLSSQVQHLAMSVFRAVENRRSLVRAATSGQTCAIAPSGKILAMAPPFTETVLNVEIPLLTSRTPYTTWGDLWAVLFCVSALILLLCGAIRSILMVIKTGRI